MTLHETMIDECHQHWCRDNQRVRYDPQIAAACLFPDRVRKVHAAGLMPHCSAVQKLTGQRFVDALCAGAEALGLRYAGQGNNRHWERAGAAAAGAAADNARPSDMHGTNILERRDGRALAVEDLVLFAEACGMSALSFELPKEAEDVFDRHVGLVRAGVRMNQDARRFLHDHLLHGPKPSGLGIPEVGSADALRVTQDAAVAFAIAPAPVADAVMGWGRRAAADDGAPVQIYLDRQFFWVRLHEMPPPLPSSQAYYIDHFPPEDGTSHPDWMDVDVVPMPASMAWDARELKDVLQLSKLSLFGKPGTGRLAVLLVDEGKTARDGLPWRLDRLVSDAAKATRAAAKDSEQEKAAMEGESLAYAEWVKWFACTLPPERLWLARRDYVLAEREAA